MNPIEEAAKKTQTETSGGGHGVKDDGGGTQNPNQPKAGDRGILRPARPASAGDSASVPPGPTGKTRKTASP